jgi:hypothetical protein
VPASTSSASAVSSSNTDVGWPVVAPYTDFPDTLTVMSTPGETVRETTPPSSLLE